MEELLKTKPGFKSIKSFFAKYEEIPDEWDVYMLGKFVKVISGDYFAYNEFVDSGIRVLKIDNVMYGKIDWESRTFLPGKYLESHKELLLKEGDIVIALNRTITNNQVKVARLSEKDIPSILYQRVGKLEFNRVLWSLIFYTHFLIVEFLKKVLAEYLLVQINLM